MGRENFKIMTGDDSIYMHDYLCTHKQKILIEFCQSSIVDVNNCEKFGIRLDILTGIDRSVLYTESEYWSMQTEFLYDINEERRTKIRTTIRARRMHEHKSKKQLTIDACIHEELKKYAKDNNLTLTDAIKHLLDNYYKSN